MKQQTVLMYDFETKWLTAIPAAELAPGMLRLTVEGIAGDVWVDGKAALGAKAPLRHPPFPEEARAHLRRLRAVFHDVYPNTLGQWEDGFRRDADPDREIAIWLRIADA